MGKLTEKDKRLFLLSPFIILSKAGIVVSVLSVAVVSLRCFNASEKREILTLGSCLAVTRVREQLLRSAIGFILSISVFLLSRYFAIRIASVKAGGRP